MNHRIATLNYEIPTSKSNTKRRKKMNDVPKYNQYQNFTSFSLFLFINISV